MYSRKTPVTGLLIMLAAASVHAQSPDSVFSLTGIIYDESYRPVPATHVINMNSHAGDVSDSLGIFRLPAEQGDTLLVRNIMYLDTLVPVVQIERKNYIVLKKAYYPLQEVRIFEWGSTYSDFSRAVINMPNRQTLGETMGLPLQDPDHIPFDMDEEFLKSPAFLIKKPIYYLYYKYSKMEKSRRKVYWMNKNREKHETFNFIISPESISEITGLSGEPLLDFMAFLFRRMVCDFKCPEIKVYSEIYSLWEVYKELQETGIM